MPTPAALRSAVEIGPAALAATLTVEVPAGLGINSIPAQSNERARALITAGPAGLWYSIFDSESSGSYEGDLDIGSINIIPLTLDRVWWTNNAARDFRLNRNRDDPEGQFSDWVNESDWAFYLLFEGQDEPLVLLVRDRRNAGGHFMSLTPTIAQATLLHTVEEGDLVNLVVADEPGG